MSALLPPSRRIVIPFKRLSDLTGIWVCLKLLAKHDCPIHVEIAVAKESRWIGTLKQVFSVLNNVAILEVSVGDNDSGWIIAMRAILVSNADEVLVLDPHAIPVRNPHYIFEYLPFKETGAVLWPKFFTPVDRSTLRMRLGLPVKQSPEVDGACLLISRRRHEDVLILSLSLLEQGDLVRLLWGNLPDSLQYAFEMLGKSFSGITTRPHPLFCMMGTDGHMLLSGMCQFDLEGEQLFQIRTRYPWLLLGDRGIGGALFEPQCLKYLRELRTRLSPALRDTSVSHPPEVCGRWLIDWRQQFRLRGQFNVSHAEGANQLEAINLDEWTRVELSDDGLVETDGELEITFWSCRQQESGFALELADADGNPLALLTSVATDIYAGHWMKTKRACRMVRGRVVLSATTRGLSPLALGEEKDPRLRHILCGTDSVCDSVATLLAACALADTGNDVVFHTNQAEWFHRLSHERLAITYPISFEADAIDPAQDPYRKPIIITTHCNSATFQAEGVGLFESKCHAIGSQLRPTMPDFVDKRIRVPRLDCAPYVLIVPFSDVAHREWPIEHWLRLAHLLREKGLDVIAVGEGDHAVHAAKAFLHSHVFWASGPSTEWMIDTMLAAEAVIATNCGLAYIAALHGVRTICLVAEFTQDYFPSELGLEVVSGAAACAGCWHRPEAGFASGCHFGCSALGGISPQEVSEKFSSEIS